MTTTTRTIEYPPCPRAAMSPKKLNIQLPPHIHRVVSKGREYYYYNPHRNARDARKSKAVRLPGTPQDPEFWAKLQDFTGIAQPTNSAETPTPRTYDALIDEYRASAEFQNLSGASKRDYQRYLGRISAHWGDIPVRLTRARNVMWLRDQYKDTPTASNYLIAVLSRLITWGIPLDYRVDNPCDKVPDLKTDGEHMPWPWDSIEFAEQQAPFHIWSVLAVCLYTGQRISDVLNMKWSDLRVAPGSNQSVIGVVQDKTKKKLWLPIHQNLYPLLERIPKCSINILTNSRGKPWTYDGFSTSFYKLKKSDTFAEFRERSLVVHGLRKSAAVTLAESGCTDEEIQAITGQSKGMVAHYTRQVNQLHLARNAILKWEALLENSRK